MRLKGLMLSFILIGSLTLSACRKGCTDEAAVNFDSKAKKDDGSCHYQQEVTLKFTQNFNGQPITVSDFNNVNYTIAHGEKLSITKLQYLISELRFYKPDGDSVVVDMYRFIDLENPGTLSYGLNEMLDGGEYSAIGFNFGFNKSDNVTGAYPDLNLLSWSWPHQIGGGYHQMKMEGRFIDADNDTVSYQFHNGSATKATTGVFEPNYFRVKLPESSFTLSNCAIIEIKMDIAEWYKNPHLWDLNAMHSMLMPDYTAQTMMSANGKSVFSLGEIIQ